MADYYFLFKALHILSFVAWMAGMLYLPRLYVYHAGVAPGSEASEMLKVMERRLLRLIINPAMIATFVFGILLIIITEAGAPGHGYWFHVKALLLVLMATFHGFCARWRKDFERDANERSAKFYRIANEIPTVLLVGIVFLAVFKPF